MRFRIRITRVQLVERRRMRLREIAVPGSQAGLVLHHLSNALGADPSTNEWAVIVMRAMVQQARGILSES